MSSKKIIIFDYEDSYTFNICELLYKVSGVIPEVVPLKLHEQYLKKIYQEGNLESLTCLLGPGPGNPDQYSQEFPILKKLIKAGVPFIGICLGHQILLQLLGYKVAKSKNPKHGSAEKIPLTPFWKSFLNLETNTLVVQRYNSLCVVPKNKSGAEQSKLLLSVDQEIMAFQQQNILTMQFHPESVGTERSKAIFEAILKFIQSR